MSFALCLSALFHCPLLARPSYGLFFRFTTAANMDPLLTEEEFNEHLRKARASDPATALDNVDIHSLLWHPTLPGHRLPPNRDFSGSSRTASGRQYGATDG
jgi:hypothetical protein